MVSYVGVNCIFWYLVVSGSDKNFVSKNVSKIFDLMTQNRLSFNLHEMDYCASVSVLMISLRGRLGLGGTSNLSPA
jgi:hypothetical protein